MTVEPHDLKAKMASFARTFPSMAKAGTDPWDAYALDRRMAESPVSHGELLTAQFLLAVWDPATAWRCGRFELMEALRVWDDRHRAAFLAWANAPWWP